MRVVTYSRVSTDDKGQNPTIQVNELSRYCQARGWSIRDEIIDHGYSGGSDSRPGLQKLLKLARSRKIEGVVVVKLDRLFRSLKHLVTTLDEFQALGIIFVATRDNVDYSTPSGRLFVQILGSLAEFEKSLLRERTILGLEHARRSGKQLGRPRRGPYEAIIALRAKGHSHSEIKKILNCSKGAICRALSTPKTSKNSELKD